MEIRKIRQLARLLKSEDLEELELQDGESFLRLKRSKRAKYIQQEAPKETPAATVAADTESPRDTVDLEGTEPILSPLAGTFYRAKAPGAPPFVNVGDTVGKGQTLCILEAMKLMNELEAEQECKIVEILIGDAQPVNEGQPLFRIIPV